jgi:GNAT superfamily N-acetyltransferase
VGSAAIREARSGEEGELLAAYEWLFASPGARPASWDPERASTALAEAIASPEAAVLVADDGSGMAGICTAYLDLNSVRYGRRCWVEDLAVRPDARSGGIGGALLDASADWARGHGASHLELDTGLARSDAQRFYDRRDPAAVGYSYSWPL